MKSGKSLFISTAVIAAAIITGCTSPEKNIEPKKQKESVSAMPGLTLRTDAPALRFPAIIPIYGNDDEKLTKTRALIKHLHETAGLTEFAISFPLNPQGNDPYEKVSIYAGRFARLKKYNDIPGIRIGVLLQQTIGHSAVWNTNPNLKLNWQRTVTMDNSPSVRYCPLDPDFREYIRRATAGIFAHKPDFTLWDDDLRLYIQKEVECFCPRHVQYFNEKYKTNYSASELQEAIKNAPDNDLLLKQFAEARLETLIDFIKVIRAELDKVNPDAYGILCTVSSQVPDMAKLAAATGGKNPPAIRVGSGLYLEREPRAIVWRTTRTAIQVASHRDNLAEMIDESDTCPHNLFSKTAHTMNLHIVFGLLHGLDGGKLWIANTRFYAPEPIIKFPQTIGKNQGLYRELHRTLKGVKWHGPVLSVPAPESDPRPEFPGSFSNEMGWIDQMTGFFGLPYACEKAEVKGVHLLTGPQIKYFTAAELKRFLSEGCILDASAAIELEKRNLGYLTGVRPEPITSKISAGEWMKYFDNPIRVFGKRQYEILPRDPKNAPEYISEFRDTDYTQSATNRKVCNGCAVFTNELGAKVVTVPFDVLDSRISIVPERQEYMRKIFDLMGVLPAWSPEPFDVFFRFGTLKNGQDIAAVCNVSYEPMEDVRIGVKKLPAKIEKLARDGGWDECRFSVGNNIITIDDQLHCADAGIYKFSY